MKEKPTVSVIVARLSKEFCGGKSRLSLLSWWDADNTCPLSRPAGYYDEQDEGIPINAIEDWQEVTI